MRYGCFHVKILIFLGDACSNYAKFSALANLGTKKIDSSIFSVYVRLVLYKFIYCYWKTHWAKLENVNSFSFFKFYLVCSLINFYFCFKSFLCWCRYYSYIINVLLLADLIRTQTSFLNYSALFFLTSLSADLLSKSEEAVKKIY